MHTYPDLNLFYPLNEFYDEAGKPLPDVVQIAGPDIPEPYRSLLVHDRDMTPTIEEACCSKVQLRILKYAVHGSVVSRQIVLVPEGGTRAVVFGAIKIYLKYFPPEAKSLVTEKKLPLGTILRTQGMAHASRPDAYIQVAADPLINEALNLTGSARLYGRRNVLLDAEQNTLARVLEILPPSLPV
jgi:chorismate-pyruvate lyase